MSMTAAEIVARTGEPIFEMGSIFMFGSQAKTLVERESYPNGFVFYIGGRGSVLGDVLSDQVASAFAFFNPAVVDKMWGRALEVKPAAGRTADFVEACTTWGEETLGAVSGATRFAELGRKVIDGVAPLGLSLFTGWRNAEAPTSPAGAAALTMHVLRELRGDLHIQAVSAVGLTGAEAVAGHGGADRLKTFGWDEGAADQAVASARRDEAMKLTDQMMERTWSILDGDELQELADVFGEIEGAVKG